MLRSPLAALALAATALAASGCGGSSKPSNTLTHAELVAKADAICRNIQAKIHANPYKTTQDIAQRAPQIAAYEQTATAELRKLIPPASMANDWKEIVNATQTLVNDTAKLGAYAKENNLKGAGPLFASVQQVARPMFATAKRDGFKDCAHA